MIVYMDMTDMRIWRLWRYGIWNRWLWSHVVLKAPQRQNQFYAHTQEVRKAMAKADCTVSWMPCSTKLPSLCCLLFWVVIPMVVMGGAGLVKVWWEWKIQGLDERINRTHCCLDTLPLLVTIIHLPSSLPVLGNWAVSWNTKPVFHGRSSIWSR